MPLFVLLTGLASLLAGLALQVPALAAVLMPGQPAGMLIHLFGAMAMFLGVMLALASRDLATRGSLVAWEGVLRLAGSAIMAGYGIWGMGGAALVAAGAFDLAVGLAYLVGLPRHLGIGLGDLLLDRAGPVSRRSPAVQNP